MDKYSVKDLTKDILIILAASAIILPVVAIAPGLPLAFGPFLKKKYQPSRVKQTLYRLQKQEVVSIKEIDGKVRIELLDKGKRRVLAYKFEEMLIKKGKWDGWWRIVIFDIPEYKRNARDFLRAKMKELGFYILQKSVLVTPWKCREEIDFIKHFYEVGEFVNLIQAKSFDGEEKVRRYFNL